MTKLEVDGSLHSILSSLMLMNVQSIRRARRFYALSCITSPGGKHRGLAGSVAVLIAESLLMLSQLYTLSVTWTREFVPDVSPVGHK